jgi:hypothetical protein
MSRSLSTAALFLLAVGAVACSTAAKPHPPPVVTVRTATLDITPRVKVLTRVRLPDGFVPLASAGPMWLEGGKEIAIIGARAGRTVILGYGGAGWRTGRVIAADGAPGLGGGAIVDAAASPGGMAIALAVVNPKQKRVNVVVRDLIARGGSGHSVASFNGVFQSASVGWLDQVTIALALGPSPAAASTPAESAPAVADKQASQSSAPGLYLIQINGMVTAELVKLKCPLSPLSWSPEGRFAVGRGDSAAPPVLIDLDKSACRPLIAPPGLRVLDWAPGGKSFLYTERSPAGEVTTYRYDLAAEKARLVAVSSSAADFTGIGDVIALGSSGLTLSRARRFPNAPALTQLALLPAQKKEIRMVSLGFNTTAAMLAASTLAYSRASHSAAIATFGASPVGVLRKIIVYRMADNNAFVVAFGPPAGPVPVAWGPKGRYLAVVDHSSLQTVLTVLQPPA